MMKKLICLCLALAMALMCVGALAEGDLQAQLDAANAKIEELQAQVDTYYPYYAAQIVATYGEDGIVWLSDVQSQYDALAQQYASYGMDLAQYGMEDSVKTDIVTSAVQEGVLLAKASELGLDQFDDETLKNFEDSSEETFQQYVDYYISYFYPDAEEKTDDMIAEAEAYWASNGLDRADIQISLRKNYLLDAVRDYTIKDVEVTDEDVQAEYEKLIESNKESYQNDRTYNSDRNSGVAIAWNPEGYRAVKHVLIKFTDEQSQRYSDLQSQLDSLDAEKEALLNPDEATATADAAAEETAEPRAQEQIDSDIAACAAELEALYAELLPKAEQVVADFDGGKSFEDLIAEYNEDPGMNAEPTASQGYAVSADSTAYDSAFTEGAMSIENVGEISGPVYGSYGIYVIYYMADIPAGEVALDEIRDGVTQDALESKQTETYDAQVETWVAEANVEYHLDNFGVAETESASEEAAAEATDAQ